MERWPKISVIVPVYNTAEYLPKCIDSILIQNYDNFELLLIDDGSEDRSGTIIDEYSAQNERVRAIHKANGGVSSARNTGIDIATGEYIVFVDSDDYVGKDYLFDLVQAADDQKPSQLILSDYQSFSTDKMFQREYVNNFKIRGGMTAEQFRYLVFEYRLFGPCCKLYQRKILNTHQIRFDTELKSAEDFEFNMQYLRYIQELKYICSVQYFYRVGYKATERSFIRMSDIKSVHIMTSEIIALSKRFGIYPTLVEEIDVWVAKKHYLSRLPMVFVRNSDITILQRRKMYSDLIGDVQYRNAYLRGKEYAQLPMALAVFAHVDCFLSWYLFYLLVRLFAC